MITAALILSAAVLVALYLWDQSKSRQVQRVSNPGATLSDAIDNTLLLVAYASRTGKPLTETDVRTVVVAKRAAAALTETAETAFWLAASSISKTLAPVTIESLISSSPDQLKGKSRAESAATTYMVLTLMTLVALLLFQIYWLIGATVISELKDNRVQLDSLSVEGLASKAAFAALDPKASNFKAQKQREEAALENWRTRLGVQRISTRSNLAVLKRWTNVWPLSRKASPSNRPPLDADTAQEAHKEFFLWEFSPADVERLGNAQITLTALLKHILPLLYGLLGACAYIVRSVANEIRDATYSPGATVRYRLRFYLGAVAGLSIAWFTSDPKPTESGGILQSLSPLALAFLAGYSVELLFSLLDRLVTAFSGPEPKTPS